MKENKRQLHLVAVSLLTYLRVENVDKKIKRILLSL
jgi:hypothetical protein